MRVGELPPTAGADQLPVTAFAPHPLMQGLVFLIYLGHIDSVTPPSQPGDSRISRRCVTEIFEAAEEKDI